MTTKFDPLATGKFVVSNITQKDITGWLVSALIGLVIWIGTSLINRVDRLAESFNAYALKMENRVTALEQHVKGDK